MSKYLIENTTLTAIADAVREKAGTTDLIKVSELPDAIATITTGAELEELNVISNGTYTATDGKGFSPVVVNVPQDGAPTAEELTFSENVSNIFSFGNWNWFIEKYGNQIVFENVTSAQTMFTSNTTIEDLSLFTIPFTTANIQSIFSNCSKLTKLPKVSGTITRYFSGFFTGCNFLSSDEANNFFKDISVPATDNNTTVNAMFSNCYSFRNMYDILEWLHTNINNYTGTSAYIANYNNLFYFCQSLDEITNLHVVYCGSPRTSNCFGNCFYFTGRLKNMMFKTNEGTPIAVNWKSQTIDLTQCVGYVSSSYVSHITNYNAGITADKRVTDDTTYQVLKDDPDWWTTDGNYSRYNHDSAVNTINSLPDTSAYLATAGGTNTIKFYGNSGSATDGGAINTLTEEEIAVAAAKGWTVTLV